MEEIQVSPKSGIAELEKVFQEYKSRLENAEQESAEIIGVAWQKAENIIAKAQEEAQQTADETKRQSKEEADRVILESKHEAEQIVKEAEDRIKKEAKDRTQREVEKIIAGARQATEKQSAEIIASSRKDADQIVDEVKGTVEAEALEESSKIIVEAKEAAHKIDKESIACAAETNKLLVEVVQKAETIFDRFRAEAQKELAELLLAVGKVQDNLESRIIIDEIKVGATDDNGKDPKNRSFEGRRELQVIPPYEGIQIKRLVEFLKKIPNIRLAGEAATEDMASIFIEILEPLPLLTLLREMSLIEDSDVRGNTIKLKLRPSNNGN
jgi:F0F1-type ATP synthase membrane subunit b/b'